VAKIEDSKWEELHSQKPKATAGGHDQSWVEDYHVFQ